MVTNDDATMKLLRSYYLLSKPGIIYSNLITVFAGFMFGTKATIDYPLLFSTLVGSACIIASGCVFNNIIDRDIDGMMTRTKGRPLVTGVISLVNAKIFGSLLFFVGICILGVFSGQLATLIAIGGFFFYIICYSLITKRTSIHGTLVGSVSGAVPPLIGYVSATQMFDEPALILFLILTAWQMPHSFAIALYREKDYESANIPVLPIVKGAYTAKWQMLLYVLLFTFFVCLLSIRGYTGVFFASIMLISGGIWIYLSIQGFSHKNETAWARKMFFYSIFMMLIFAGAIIADSLFLS